jgi:hypothetical protein
MGADNTYGEENFNPKQKTEILANAIISEMEESGLDYDQMLAVIELTKQRLEFKKP